MTTTSSPALNRRRFLTTSAGAATLGMTGGTGALASGVTDDWAAAFDRGLAQHPWLLGYATAQRNEYVAQAEISGRWPAALTGTLFRNGPAAHQIGTYRYHHWFDGDGLLQAYRLDGKGVTHKAKFVQTFKRQAEQEAGRALYPGFGSVPPRPAPVTGPDAVNVANISVLHHHDRLLALWEAGSPWEMDADTLDTVGPYSFSDFTSGVPFSAHPRVEADGTLWNFGYLSAANTMVLWHIDRHGKIVKADKFPLDPITMVHDFVVTSRHIVLVVAPFHYRGNASNFLDAHEWQPDDPTRVVVIDKNDFGNRFEVELPAQWVFHFGNGWEDDAGVIRFDAARADSPLVMIDNFRGVMRGEPGGPSPSHHHQYRIDTRARTISEAPLFGTNVDSEFPCTDPRVSCRRNRTLTMLTADSRQPAPHGGLSEVSTFDLDSGKRATYRYPATMMPEEHLFVPRPGSAPETDGWVVGTALDWQAQVTVLNVFDASAVNAGPIATARLPYALPLGLHGKFVHA